MDVLAIRVSDYLFNIGNRVFNVKDVEYRNNNDLDYEESNVLPINKIFYTIDEKVKYFENKYDFFTSKVLRFFISLLSVSKFKKVEKEQQYPINIFHKSDPYNSNAAHTVISNNVRNRLLKTINEGINPSDYKPNIDKNKKVKKLKNQFKSEIKETEDLNYVTFNSISLINKISLLIKRFI